MYSKAIKNKAKEIMLFSKPNMFGVAIVFVSVSTLFTFFITKISGVSMTEDQVQQYYDMFFSGNTQQATEFAMRYFPGIKEQLFGLLLVLAKIILAGGFMIFVKNAVRKNNEACIENLLDGFSIAFKLIFMKAVKIIIVSVGFLFFIAPGVILFYLYRQSCFLLIDNPSWNVFKCLKESRKMMKGNIQQLILLDVNFIPMWIMSFIPMTGIFIEPYTKTSYFLYYELIRDKQHFFEILDTKYA